MSNHSDQLQRSSGMAKLIRFYLQNGLILHALDQLPSGYFAWWEDACEEGYLVRGVWGIWHLSAVTEAGLRFFQNSDLSIANRPRPKSLDNDHVS